MYKSALPRIFMARARDTKSADDGLIRGVFIKSISPFSVK